MEKVTISSLHEMKRSGQKIAAVVAWDVHMARIADRAGVDMISVGDSVGVNLWGRDDLSDITLDEMILVCQAVRRGTKRALVSCDLPPALIDEGIDGVVRAAVRVVEKAGADMVKLDGIAEYPEIVTAVERAGIPVFAEFSGEHEHDAVGTAKRFEVAGASLIDFKHSGPVAGPAVVSAVSIPVLGGLGGGPWLDGRIRLGIGAIGYAARSLDSNSASYANVARITLDALTAYTDDVRSGRQIRG